MEKLNDSNIMEKPSITFNSEGLIVIKGRAINIDSQKAFMPAFRWSKQLKSKEVNCIMILDFINAGALRKITELFFDIERNTNVRDVNIHWYFDKEDSSILETANILADMFPTFIFSLKKLELLEFKRKLQPSC